MRNVGMHAVMAKVETVKLHLYILERCIYRYIYIYIYIIERYIYIYIYILLRDAYSNLCHYRLPTELNPYTRMCVSTIGSLSLFRKIMRNHCETPVESWFAFISLIFDFSVYFNYS